MIEKVRSVLNSKNVDSIFIKSRNNVGYTSSFWGSFGAVLITKNENYLFTDFRYQEQARNTVQGFSVKIVSGNLYDEIANIIERENIHSMGIEDDELTVADFNRLGKKTGNVKKYFISDALYQLRMIKTPKEIETIKTAEQICDFAFSKVLNYIKESMTEKELENELAYQMKKEGAEGFAFDSIVVSGNRSSLVHGTPSDKPIQKGDFVLMDFGATYKNYCSDITRTVAVGRVSEYQKEIYEIVLNAQINAINAIKEGVMSDFVDNAGRSIIKNAGYGENFGHSLGHGVGTIVHEGPVLSPKGQTELKENMIVTVEPGIYLENQFGVRIEDLVQVTKAGCINLTNSPKELLLI